MAGWGWPLFLGSKVFRLDLVLQFTADILFLKHACSTIRQSSNPVCGSWKSQASSPRGPNSTALTCYIMANPHTWLDDCLNKLLCCFRKRMSNSQLLSFDKDKTLSHHPITPASHMANSFMNVAKSSSSSFCVTCFYLSRPRPRTHSAQLLLWPL